VVENVTTPLDVKPIIVRKPSFSEGLEEPTPTAPAKPVKPNTNVFYTDVLPTNPAYRAITYVSDFGIMNGTGSNQFSPNASLTRAMMATILWRMEGQPGAAYNGKFSDVPAGQWYSEAITWANAAGIVEGYGNGVFGLNDSLTHGQLCAMLYRWNAKTYGNISTAWNWAQASGLYSDLSGITETSVATRAEIAQVLMAFAIRVW
jgi:hypothetical protein